MASFNLGFTLGPMLGALVDQVARVRGGVRHRRASPSRAAYYALLRLPADAADGQQPARRPAVGASTGCAFLKRSPNLRMTFILDLCAMVLAQPRALFPALAYKVYGGGAGVVGLLQAAPAAGAVVAFLFSGLGQQGPAAGAGDRHRGASSTAPRSAASA